MQSIALVIPEIEFDNFEENKRVIAWHNQWQAGSVLSDIPTTKFIIPLNQKLSTKHGNLLQIRV